MDGIATIGSPASAKAYYYDNNHCTISAVEACAKAACDAVEDCVESACDRIGGPIDTTLRFILPDCYYQQYWQCGVAAADLVAEAAHQCRKALFDDYYNGN